MIYSRDILTGRTRTLTADISVALNYCGGTSADYPVDGWKGSNFYHITAIGPERYHQLFFGSNFDSGFYIRTGVSSGNPYNPGSGDAWVTGIYKADGTVVKEWANDADPAWDVANSSLTPPSETITAHLTCSLKIEEVARESWFGSLRPSSATEIKRAYFYKPVGNVKRNLTYTGGSYSDSEAASGLSSHSDAVGFLSEYKNGYYLGETDKNTAFGCYAYVNWNEPTDTYYDTLLGEHVHVQDLPYPNVKIANVSMSMDAELNYFGWNGKNPPVGVSLVHAFGITSAPLILSFPFYAFPALPDWDHTSLYIAQAGSSVSVEVPGLGFVPPATPVVHGWQGYNGSIRGSFKDWNNADTGVQPLPFGNRVQFELLNPATVLDIDPLSRQYPNAANADTPVGSRFSPCDGAGTIYENDSEYDAISLNHAKTIVVDTFIRTYPSGHGWIPTNVTLSNTSDGLKCIGAGSEPYIIRPLKNDLDDFRSSPPAWVSSHSAEIEARTPGFLSWFVGETGGADTEKAGPGQWPILGKKLLADSDIFNWSAYRYAYLTAKSDASCNVSITILWDAFFIRANWKQTEISPYTYVLERSEVETIFTIPLTTSLITHEIDLAAKVGHNGLRSIHSIKYAFPDGRTIWLKELKLERKNNAQIEVHTPSVVNTNGITNSEDVGWIAATIDGKNGLFINTDYCPFYPSKTMPKWGFPIKCFEISDTGDGIHTNYDYLSSYLMKTLAFEIGLQEGWSASVGAYPNDFAIYLKEQFPQDLPATLKAQKCFGAIADGPGEYRSYTYTGQLGHGDKGITYDIGHENAVSVPIQVDIPPTGSYPSLAAYPAGILIDHTNSKANGEFTHQLEKITDVEFRTNVGSPAQIIYLAPTLIPGGTYAGVPDDQYVSTEMQTFPRSILWVTPSGVPQVSTGGNPWICTSSDLESYVAIIKDGALQLARKRGAETDFTYFHVATGVSDPSIAKHEKNKDYPLYIAGNIEGPPKKVVFLKNTTYGDTSGLWKIKVVAEGTHGFVQVEESLNLLFISYWRGGNFYLKKTSDEGATWLKWGSSGTDECTIKTGVPEQHFTFDMLSTKDRTFIGVYTDTTGTLLILKSTDLGDTWS